MKKSMLLFMAVAILGTLLGQSPQAFKYQAVARDAAGEVIQNQNVSFLVSILQGSANGTVVYSEIQAATTNDYGLVSLEIGNGVPLSGNFTTIDWGTGSYFMKVEMDENGGNNFTWMGTTQLMSVPYALYAENSGDGSAWQSTGDDIYYEDGKVGIGTNAPQTDFHVDGGDLRITNGQIDFGDNHRVIKYTTTGNMSVQSPGPVSVVIDNNNNSTNTAAFTVRKDNNDPDLATEIFRVQEDGRVGIGTTDPQAPLDVNGRIQQSGIGNSVFIGPGAGENDDLTDN